MAISSVRYLPATYSRRRGGRTALLCLTLPYPLAVLGLSVVQALHPARNGPFALAQVFAAFFFFPLVLLLPFALLRGMSLLRLALVVCALVYGARFMPHVNAFAAPESLAGQGISVLSWNVAAGGDKDQVDNLLLTKPADIVALVEAYPAEVENDANISAVYPHHYGPYGSQWDQGIVILSAYPVVDRGVVPTGPSDNGSVVAIWAVVDAGGKQITVVAAHPPHGITCGRKLPRPNCYDTRDRDDLLQNIHSFVAQRQANGETILLMGDFNITEREPGYTDISEGLVDAYRTAGTGFGNSWSPDFLLKGKLAGLKFPILRIDYQFSSPNLRPTRLYYDCTPRGSDHCAAFGSYEF